MDYNFMSDEQLTKLAQDKDSDAFDILISRYKTLVTKIARSYYLAGGEIDDLLQEGIIGFFKAIGSFNFKSEFKSYAQLCIKNSIITSIKSANRLKNRPLLNYVSLSNDEIKKSDDFKLSFNDVIDPEETFINNESEKELEVTIKESLSCLENSILILYLQGYSYRDISLKIGKNQKTIDNAVQRIRKKLSNALNSM